MIEPLLALPANVRARLVRTLETGQVAPPYGEASLRGALGRDDVTEVRAALVDLEQQGVAGPAVAFALALAAEAEARVVRPDLVWSGPNVAGLHARDTRRVYEELVGEAQHTLWISAYVYFGGPKAFASLAQRMDTVPELQVTLLLNIQRKWGDTTSSDGLVRRFADRLWDTEWPGARRPDVFYDPRSLDPDGPAGVLHAKAVIADDAAVFITSANLTEAAFERNIEVGVVSRDRALATSLALHFRVLVEQGLLRPLPVA